MVFKESFKGGSRKFQGCCFKKVSWVSFGRYMGVSRGFRKKIQRVSHRSFVSRMFEAMFKSVKKKFQGCFKTA